jgi:hypothetical protein
MTLWKVWFAVAALTAAGIGTFLMSDHDTPPAPKPPWDYRDTWLEAKLRSLARRKDTTRELMAKWRGLYGDSARSMPPGSEGEQFLINATAYFRGDPFQIWNDCREAQKNLARDGFAGTPDDWLKRALATAKNAGILPGADIEVKGFFLRYGGLRKMGMDDRDALLEVGDWLAQ